MAACWTWSDDFDRAEIGNDWDVLFGNWSIVGGKLRGQGEARIIMADPVSPAQFSHTLAVWFDPTATGATIRIIVNYVDEDNYFYAQYIIGGALSLWRRELGEDTMLAQWATPLYSAEMPIFYACFTEEFFAASVNTPAYLGQELYVCAPGRFSGGDKAGIAIGSNHTVDFDLWEITEIYPPNPLCPTCICTCDGGCIPTTLLLTLTLENPAGGCQYPGLHGQEITLTRQQYEGGAMLWTGEATLCGVAITWVFGCADHFWGRPGYPHEGCQYVLEVDTEETATISCCEDSVACNPLAITFEIMTLLGPEYGPIFPCCPEGEANVLWGTITEVPP